MKRLAFFAILSALGLAGGLWAQTPDKLPEFEAASVKPTGQPSQMIAPGGRVQIRFGCSGGPGTDDPGRYSCTGMNLRSYITQAYGVRGYEISGPDTLDSLRFDVEAKIPQGTTPHQFKQMLQRLLADRFHLATHQEKRELPVYALIVSKDGHKMQPAKEGDTETAADAIAKDRDGDRATRPPSPMPGGEERVMRQMVMIGAGPKGRGSSHIAMSMVNGRTMLYGRSATIADLTGFLSGQLNRPVIDHTELNGAWNFTIEFELDDSVRNNMGAMMAQAHAAAGVSMPAESAEPSGAPSVFTAFQKQLGLKLEPRKEPADIVVVDRFEKTPTDN